MADDEQHEHDEDLDEDLEEGLGILAEMLQRPAFRPNEIDTERLESGPYHHEGGDRQCGVPHELGSVQSPVVGSHGI